MADIKALRSYLVSLGFSVNTAQANQFNNAIKSAASIVNISSKNMLENITKFGMGAVAAMEAVAIATGAMMEKAAKADQEYRLFGQRMFMTTEAAKRLKIAQEALGAPLEAIAFDPELHRRFDELERYQKTLQGMLGPDFKATMIQLRNAQFEFTRFKVEAIYFRDLLVKNIFQALGGERLTAKLREWNDYIVRHIPEWSRIIAKYIVPVLKDAWSIAVDLFNTAKSFAGLFTEIIGVISGDPALQGTTSFEKFAAALAKVAHWLAVIVHLASKFAGTIAGAGIGFMIGGLPGAAIGAAAGGLLDVGRDAQSRNTDDAGISGTSGLTLDQAANAIAGVESGGRQYDAQGNIMKNPKSSALGIMQLTKGTAAQLGVDPTDARQNFMGGKRYLAQQYSKFGNWHDAFAAYYWGPGNVEQALKMHQPFRADAEAYAQNALKRAATRGSIDAANVAVTIGSINITQPNATPHQISQAVGDEVTKRLRQHTANQIGEFRPAYG